MGATIPQQYSAAFQFNRFGVVTGTATPTQFPTGTCGMVRFKADPDNNDDFMLGNESGNVLYPLAPGDDTGWVSLSNLNQLWYSAISGSLDYLYWWLQV
jgi:hypothetical protein